MLVFLLFSVFFFFFNDTATTEIYTTTDTLSLHDALPITSTLRASAGASPEVAKIVRTVGTATKTRMAAGARVQAISRSVWPCVGLGAARPSRWRKRISVTTSSVSTTRNTPAAHQKMSVKRTSVARAKSERGRSVDCGNGPPHPDMTSAAVGSQSRSRPTATKILTPPLRPSHPGTPGRVDVVATGSGT